MDKLYPPVIEGTIPAFYGTTLVVPFSMNRAVGKNDIQGFSLKIKTIQTNTFLANIKSISYTTTQAKFDVSSVDLVAGQYYKLQIAYIAKDSYSTVGYYSTVGVVKYYGEQGPVIYIDGLSSKKSNLFTGSYIGVFEHDTEPMEKVAQYNFTITTSDGELVYSTGWLIHNTINDIDSKISNDIFKYTDELDVNNSYYLQYKVITSNNMACETPKYKILQRNSIGTDLNLQLTATEDYENGYVALSLKSLGAFGENATLTGAFEISRQNIKNPRHWEVIFTFILQNEVATKTIWRDFTVQHGETYRYGIRQFNEAGVYTDRVLSNQVYCDFEDAFLFDGKRQLKIKYNPKISSFKNDIPESKTDTIGSKYPFIFRNGYVNYKEFPISGLISYWSDEEEFFLTNEELGIKDITNWVRNDTPNEDELPKNIKTKNLVNYNIAAERKFKLDVLDWLTDGQPKLFRSPTEGNYIVRLLNTTLTPTDTLGRMLHSFQCVAYEIADNIYENLVSCGFIKNSLDDDEKLRKYYRTVPLGYQGHEADEEKYIPIITGKNSQYPEDEFGYIELLRNPENSSDILHAYAIYFDDMVSNDVIWINDKKVVIGSTGQYILEKTEFVNSVKIRALPGYNDNGEWSKDKAEADIEKWRQAAEDAKQAEYDAVAEEIVLRPWTSDYKAEYLEGIAEELDEKYAPIFADINYSKTYDNNFVLNDFEGLFTYSYTDDYANTFDLITGQKLVDYPCRQIVGDDITRNILNDILDVRTELVDILQIQAELKQVENIYTWDDTIVTDTQRTFTPEEFNQYFSFDRVKSPKGNKGNSWDEIHDGVFNPLQENYFYIYKINPIFKHQEVELDSDIANNYKESLSPWELKELGKQVATMLAKYNLTLADVTKFLNHETDNEKYIDYPTRDDDGLKSMKDMIKIIKLNVQDFKLLEKYFGKEEFNYANSDIDPVDSHVEEIWVYKVIEVGDKIIKNDGTIDNAVDSDAEIGKKGWALIPAVYHKNEGYYVDATYYNGRDYKEYNKYYTFGDENYYLIYKNGNFHITKGYSSNLYINTGVTSGTYQNRNGELCAPDGSILHPYLDLAETKYFKTNLIPDITDIYVGDGVILNLSYQAREIEYSLEQSNKKLKELKEKWINLVDEYIALYYTRKDNTKADEYNFNDEEWKNNFDIMQHDADAHVAAIKEAYKEYADYLAQKIKQYKEEHALA